MTRRKKSGRWWKGLLVIIASVALTTLAIRASDSLLIPGQSFLASVGFSSKESARCTGDMVFVNTANGGFCIDKYENSAGKDCLNADPKNSIETQLNLDNNKCFPVSVKSTQPWTNVPLQQAQLLCARAGKRLPTNSEWYRAAMGTSDAVPYAEGGCAMNTTGKDRKDTTGHERCMSSAGAYDMVGNVWEWVDATVQDGVLAGVTLPPSGYVSEMTSDGVPAHTAAESEASFGGDYFFIDQIDTRGMFRGGFYAMDQRGGIYAINATTPTSFVGAAVGFRCVK